MKKGEKRSKKRKNRQKVNSVSKRTQMEVAGSKKKPRKEQSVKQQKPAYNVPQRSIEAKIVRHGSGIGESFRKLRQFFREAKTELKKVKWPTRKELVASTAVVLVLVIIMAIFFWIVDYLLMLLFNYVLG